MFSAYLNSLLLSGLRQKLTQKTKVKNLQQAFPPFYNAIFYAQMDVIDKAFE